jgi:hypothetical protein
MVVPEYMDAVGNQGRRNHFPFVAGQYLSIPGK